MLVIDVFVGKIVFVIGFVRGIGWVIVFVLVIVGVDVVVVDFYLVKFLGERYYCLCSRVSDESEDVLMVDVVAVLGCCSLEIELDVADVVVVEEVVARVAVALVPIDILVNNVGIVNNIVCIV